jgi:thymidylate kinase
MIIEVASIAPDVSDLAAAMIRDSIAEQEARIIHLSFENEYDLEDPDHRDMFRAHVSHWLAHVLAPALLQKDTAVIVSNYVSTLLAQNNNIHARNLIRTAFPVAFHADYTMVIDVSPENVHADMCETCKQLYTIEMLQRERDILLTLAEQSPSYYVFPDPSETDMFDYTEQIAEHIWSITA